MALDILMAISDAQGSWITAEGQSRSTAQSASASDKSLSGDKFTMDLSAGQLFEVEEFSLGLGIQDRDDGDEKTLKDQLFVGRLGLMLRSKNLNQTDKGKELDNKQTERMAEGMAGRLKKKGRRKFENWLSGEDGAALTFPLDFQEFEFTRQMDRASIEFFDACCNSRTLKKAVVVKRKSGVGQQSYLRIDFENILIVSVDWDVDETVKEKVKFICRGATVKYRPQLATGGMGSTQQAEWDAANELET